VERIEHHGRAFLAHAGRSSNLIYLPKGFRQTSRSFVRSFVRSLARSSAEGALKASFPDWCARLATGDAHFLIPLCYRFNNTSCGSIKTMTRSGTKLRGGFIKSKNRRVMSWRIVRVQQRLCDVSSLRNVESIHVHINGASILFIYIYPLALIESQPCTSN